MREKIDFFLPCTDLAAATELIKTLRESLVIRRIHLMATADFTLTHSLPDGCTWLPTDSLQTSATVERIARCAEADYTMLCTKASPVALGLHALERFLLTAEDTHAAMVYADRLSVENGKTVRHPVIDYQTGSLRDDFDFGSLLLINTQLLHRYASQPSMPSYAYAGLYDLRLYLSRQGTLFHLNEFLYTEEETDTRQSGEKQFDYVNPRNREVQVEMEQAATNHLQELSALVDTDTYTEPDFAEQEFPVEASVVIPVYNREKTICDAVGSALAQKTSFAYNVIVVDNHSTDRTTALLQAYTDPRLVHIIPSRTDLGIGGCWNTALDDKRCGRFAVQLDSDDLYSSEQTLQTIVEAFRKQHAAMIVGAYRMCDFHLQTLPPGLIDHREWTDDNGCNNALRINGLGAPRAFFTPLARQIRFPNTSYGEDYAMGLAFSRRFRIGRIYDELYLCRRWGGNSDAALSLEKVNANNLYKDRLRTIEIAARRQMNEGKADLLRETPLQRFFDRQLSTWEEARLRYKDLQNVQTKECTVGQLTIRVQHNPARMVSTGAAIDTESLRRRPCFLCAENRPEQQIVKTFDRHFDFLVNPFPILPVHFTVAGHHHEPQHILGNYEEIHAILGAHAELTVFYNGPLCGASAPDHVHLQAVAGDVLPLQSAWQRLSRNLQTVFSLNENEQIALITDYPCPAFAIRSRCKESDSALFKRLYNAMEKQDEAIEPSMNIVSWRNGEEFISVVFPRGKHRPACYYEETGAQLLVSPGALDMAGLIITPRQEDFEHISDDDIARILREVSITPEEAEQLTKRLKTSIPVLKTFPREPEVSVGIMSGDQLHFLLNKPYTAKGESVEGEQTVALADGAILWNGQTYKELTFSPLSTDASFSLSDVTIGVHFHWERKETQVFQGTLKLVVEADNIVAINLLPVERYLTSVISSEMSATSSLELLKAHAVISRSWLLAQMEKRRLAGKESAAFFSFIKSDDEWIRWYDREDHSIFDVCADDHCQRYQGITKTTDKRVAQAVKDTKGEILAYNGEICDARFSKCCGGVTEEFDCCWEDKQVPYLIALRDNPDGLLPDLTKEEQAEAWIRTPEPAYCHTTDPKILSQVLNDYDQETHDFYRWRVEMSQEHMAALISKNTGIDFGLIQDLIPVERGKSGRIKKLCIVGEKKTFTIGKELEIRRVLSETHLYSSAFVVEKNNLSPDGTPASFTLIGAGWGHGVGLCQIGAAVMGAQGHSYDDILLHYYRGAEIKKAYR